VEPYKGGEIEPSPNGFTPWEPQVIVTERPDWTELRPPYHPDSAIEVFWSNWLTPMRGVALGFLWITFTWLRSAIFVSVIIALLMILFFI
jgi:hypothetical protein